MPAKTQWERPVAVGRVEEFPEGEMTIHRVGGLELGIVRWQGDVYAVRNRCPHQGAPVCRGHLGPKIVAPEGAVGAMAIDQNVPVLACGWHGWEFDVRDGTPAWGEAASGRRTRRYRLQTMPVSVEDGVVSVRLPTHADRGRDE